MLAIGAVLLHGVPACLAGGDEQLNPQPLPPEPPPDDSRGPPTSGENSSGSSSGGATPTGPFPDAGTSLDGEAGAEATSDGGDQ